MVHAAVLSPAPLPDSAVGLEGPESFVSGTGMSCIPRSSAVIRESRGVEC